MPSSGKSTVGKILAEKLSRKLTDTDALIEEREKRTIEDIFKTMLDQESNVLDTYKASIDKSNYNIHQLSTLFFLLFYSITNDFVSPLI